MDSNSPKQVCHCIGCHREIQHYWAFCPDCAADNRQPELRSEIDIHEHESANSGTFCVICGSSMDGWEPATGNEKLVGILFGLVGLFAVVIPMIMITAPHAELSRRIARIILTVSPSNTRSDTVFFLIGSVLSGIFLVMNGYRMFKGLKLDWRWIFWGRKWNGYDDDME